MTLPQPEENTPKELEISRGASGGHPWFLSLKNFLRSLLLPKNAFLFKLGLTNFYLPFGKELLSTYRGWNCPRIQWLGWEGNIQEPQQDTGQPLVLEVLQHTVLGCTALTLFQPSLDLPTYTVVHTFLYLQFPNRYLLAHLET